MPSAPDNRRVRCGITIFLRVPGLRDSVDRPNSLTFAYPGDKPGADVTVELIVSDPPPLAKSRPSREHVTIVQGGSAVLTLGYQPSEFVEMKGIVVRISKLFPVPDDISYQELLSGGVTSAEKHLGSMIESSLGAITDAAAGVLYQRFRANHPELLVRAHTFWLTSTPEDIAHFPSSVGVVAPIESDIASLQPEATAIAQLLAAPNDRHVAVRRLAATCSRMMLMANGMRSRSPEQVMAYYRCIELIVRQFDPSPTAAAPNGLMSVRALLKTLPASDEVLAAVRIVDSTIAKAEGSPPIAAAFRRVAALWRAPHEDQDVERFLALKSVRNQIGHGHLVEVPQTSRGFDMRVISQELAQDYFGEFLSRSLSHSSLS